MAGAGEAAGGDDAVGPGAVTTTTTTTTTTMARRTGGEEGSAPLSREEFLRSVDKYTACHGADLVMRWIKGTEARLRSEEGGTLPAPPAAAPRSPSTVRRESTAFDEWLSTHRHLMQGLNLPPASLTPSPALRRQEYSPSPSARRHPTHGSVGKAPFQPHPDATPGGASHGVPPPDLSDIADTAATVRDTPQRNETYVVRGAAEPSVPKPAVLYGGDRPFVSLRARAGYFAPSPGSALGGGGDPRLPASGAGSPGRLVSARLSNAVGSPPFGLPRGGAASLSPPRVMQGGGGRSRSRPTIAPPPTPAQPGISVGRGGRAASTPRRAWAPMTPATDDAWSPSPRRILGWTASTAPRSTPSYRSCSACGERAPGGHYAGQLSPPGLSPYRPAPAVVTSTRGGGGGAGGAHVVRKPAAVSTGAPRTRHGTKKYVAKRQTGYVWVPPGRSPPRRPSRR